MCRNAHTPGAEGCTVINGPVTEKICPQVDALRKELAIARRVADLEEELAAAQEKLHSVPVAATVSDPQSVGARPAYAGQRG